MAKNSTSTEVTITLNGQAAEQVLKGLSNQSKQLKKDLIEVSKAGDTTKIKQIDKELKSIESTMRNVKRETVDYSNVLKNINGSSMRDLEKAKKAIRREIRGMSTDTQEYIGKVKSLQLVENQIKDINIQIKGQETGVKELIVSFSKYFGIATAVIAAVTGIAFGLNGMIQGNARLSDSFADVQKTTGMTKAEVVDLNKTLRLFDTRTPRKELLDLARDAGKLGYSAKEDVVAFVKAGDQIKVALGEDLGEDAIKNIAKLNDLFGITKNLGMEKALLSTGSAINSLGQSSTASESYMVDFTKRLGGIGATANITIPNILGMAATLDQLGQTAEVSSTAMNKFIINMFKKTELLSETVGINLDVLNKKLKEDTNGALIMVLEAINKKGGLADLAPLFADLGAEGARAGNVITALAKDVDRLKEQQKLANIEFAKATSVTTEYDIRNQNFAATLEKLGKNVSGWFMNSSVMGFFSDIVTGLEQMTRKNKDATTQFNELSETIINQEQNFVPLLDRYDELKAKANLSNVEQTEMKTIIEKIAEVMPGTISEFDKYGKAIGISTERAREWIATQKVFLGETYKKSIKKTKKELAKATTDFVRLSGRFKEIQKTGTYSMMIADGVFVNADRKDVEAFMERYGKQQKKVTLLQEKLNVLTGANLDLIVASAKKKEEYTHKTEEELMHLALSQDGVAVAELERRKKLKEETTKINETVVEDEKKTNETIEENKKKLFQSSLQEIEESNNQQKMLVKQQYVDRLTDQKQYSEELYDQELFGQQQYYSELYALEQDLADRKIILYKQSGKDTAEIETKILDDRIKVLEGIKSAVDKVTEDLDKDLSKILSKGFDKSLDEIGKEFGKKLKDDIGDLSEDNNEFYEKLIKTKQEVDNFKSTWLEATPKEEHDKQIEELERLQQTGLISHENYSRMKSAIDKKYNMTTLEEWSNTLSAMSQIVGVATTYYEMQKAKELQAAGDNEEAKEAIERKYFEKQKKVQIAEARIAGGLAIMRIWAGKISGNPVVDTIIKATLTAAQIIQTEMQVSKMNAQSYDGGGGSSGTSERVIATGREKGGKFKVERAQDGKVFEAEIDPYKRGFIGKPTVLVGESGEEFVVNADAVKNPSIKPILDIINMAQQQGAVSSLNLPKAIQSLPGLEQGGSFSGSSGLTQNKQQNNIDYQNLTIILNDLHSVLAELKKNNIKAYIVFNELNRAMEIEQQSVNKGIRD